MKYLGVFLIFLGMMCTGCDAQAQTPAPPPINIGIDPNAWARVPSGEFLMGLHSHMEQDLLTPSKEGCQPSEG